MSDHASGVRIDVGVPYRPHVWPRASLQSRCWEWSACRNYRCKHCSHTDNLKLRAIVSSILWRCRRAGNHSTRCPHLCDSQASCGIAGKGRTSSWKLRAVCRRLNSIVVAGDVYPHYSFLSSEDNPSDLPSRCFVAISARKGGQFVARMTSNKEHLQGRHKGC